VGGNKKKKRATDGRQVRFRGGISKRHSPGEVISPGGSPKRGAGSTTNVESGFQRTPVFVSKSGEKNSGGTLFSADEISESVAGSCPVTEKEREGRPKPCDLRRRKSRKGARPFTIPSTVKNTLEKGGSGWREREKATGIEMEEQATNKGSPKKRTGRNETGGKGNEPLANPKNKKKKNKDNSLKDLPASLCKTKIGQRARGRNGIWPYSPRGGNKKVKKGGPLVVGVKKNCTGTKGRVCEKQKKTNVKPSRRGVQKSKRERMR